MENDTDIEIKTEPPPCILLSGVLDFDLLTKKV